MALIEQGHFIADHILARLRLQIRDLFLQGVKRGLLIRRHRRALLGQLALPLIEEGPHTGQLVERQFLFVKILRPDGPRAFERHVLIQVGQAGLADLLIHPAHPECNVDRDHRRLMALDHEDGQAVRQFVFDHPVGKTRPLGEHQVEVQAKAEDDSNTECRPPPWRLPSILFQSEPQPQP